jgi:hypothetical protein
MNRNNKHRTRGPLDPAELILLKVGLMSTRRDIKMEIKEDIYLTLEKGPLAINKTTNPELQCGS